MGTGVCAPSSGRGDVGLHEELVKILSLFLPAGFVCRDGDDVGVLQAQHETFDRFGIERAALCRGKIVDDELMRDEHPSAGGSRLRDGNEMVNSAGE